MPGTAVTIARSSPASKFKREDFPALGFPRITVFIPSVKIRPFSDCFKILSSCSNSFSTISSNWSWYPSKEICSGSSNADSIKAIWYKISSLNFLIWLETDPFNWQKEASIAYWFLALIKSITASACDKSILPFKNALFVNSPGSAALAPYFKTVFKISCTIKAPPWQSISTVSSLV